MANRVRTVALTDEQRAVLQRQVRRRGAPAREVERARIVLLAADGVPGVEIAERVGCSEPTVIRWRSRFADHGLAGVGRCAAVGEAADDPAGGA
jgi:CRP-like cAMP-binding protein